MSTGHETRRNQCPQHDRRQQQCCRAPRRRGRGAPSPPAPGSLAQAPTWSLGLVASATLGWGRSATRRRSHGRLRHGGGRRRVDRRNRLGRDGQLARVGERGAAPEEHGEAGLRMNDLVDQSGTTVGSIYHFYGSREGVIEAVRAEQFRQVLATNGTQRDVQELVDALNAVQDRGELVGLATTFLTRFFTDQAAEELWQTFEIIGSARLRPGLRQAVIDVQ
ncbi:MAG: helix-turn-helix domain-containing protein, partial [Pseudomonadota bacterium]